MKCPVCHTETIVVEHKSIEVDYCTTCCGVWFDAGELELLLSGGDAPVMGSVNLKPASSVERRRKCPLCMRWMNKVTAGEGPNVIIDSCSQGHGLWFDGGELGQIIAQETKEPAGKSEIISFLGDVFQARGTCQNNPD